MKGGGGEVNCGDFTPLSSYKHVDLNAEENSRHNSDGCRAKVQVSILYRQWRRLDMSEKFKRRMKSKKSEKNQTIP